VGLAAAFACEVVPICSALRHCHLMQAVVWQGRQQSVSVHLKFLLWPAAIVYIWVLYTSTRIYLEHWDVASPLERIFLLATACFQTVLGTAAAVAETVK